jgi:hypothetical protein
LIGGCNSAKPPVHTAPQTVYPDHTHLVATGTSTESMEDAENRARSAIAAQIRSSLQSQTVTSIGSENRDGFETYLASTNQRIQQYAAFSHAELIHIDLDSRREQDGTYHVVAYLPRREAGQVLYRDYDRAATALTRSTAAVDAVPSGDLPAFAAAYGEARESYDELHQRAMELWAVSGQPPANLPQDQARWDVVEMRRQELVGDLRLSFKLLPVRPAGDRLDEAYLHQEFVQALTDLGLTVRGDECGDGDFLLELQPRLHYKGVIGVVCRLDFAGRLVECLSGDAWNVHLEDPDFVGEGANAYTARNGALDQVDHASLAPLLIDALGANLPVN